MIPIVAGAVGVLFGAGIRLILTRDLFRVAAGSVLVSNAVILFLVAVGRSPDLGALDPLRDVEIPVDPLAQALALTAIVVSFGVAAVLLALTVRVFLTHGTVNLDRMAEQADEEWADRSEREEG